MRTIGLLTLGLGALGLFAVAPAPAQALQGATIEGVVRIRTTPPRRTAARYPGAGPAARPIQDIPAVVYLQGQVGGAPAPGAEQVMAQQDTAFAPPLLVVPMGSAVEFPNRDPFFHNVFSYSSAGRFDLGRYPRGESKGVVFDEPGVVKIYCEVHESMRAAILVTENRHHAVLDDEGRFTLRGVPPGTYTLVAWHADRGTAEREVTVTANGTVRVELELK